MSSTQEIRYHYKWVMWLCVCVWFLCHRYVPNKREREKEWEKSDQRILKKFHGKFVSNSFSLLFLLRTQWKCHSFTPTEVEVHLSSKASNNVNAQLICMKCFSDKMYYDEIFLCIPFQIIRLCNYVLEMEDILLQVKYIAFM